MSINKYHIQVFKDTSYDGIDIMNEVVLKNNSLKIRQDFIEEL